MLTVSVTRERGPLAPRTLLGTLLNTATVPTSQEQHTLTKPPHLVAHTGKPFQPQVVLVALGPLEPLAPLDQQDLLALLDTRF